ncbi:hypothetical protein A1D31_25375 [Bradyrhizobium liaoningense]|nr:hypothetical protein A1D31_25375 [Bradyrhizobium liaoningense]
MLRQDSGGRRTRAMEHKAPDRAIKCDVMLQQGMLDIRRSFRGDAKHRTRNLEIPGSRFASPGMTVDWALHSS